MPGQTAGIKRTVGGGMSQSTGQSVGARLCKGLHKNSRVTFLSAAQASKPDIHRVAGVYATPQRCFFAAARAVNTSPGTHGASAAYRRVPSRAVRLCRQKGIMRPSRRSTCMQQPRTRSRSRLSAS